MYRITSIVIPLKTTRVEDMQPGISTSIANDANTNTVNRTKLWRILTVLGAVALAYFVTARVSLAILQLGASASPVWPPAGIALTALLWQGRWAGIGVAVGVLWLNASLDVPLLLSVGSTLGSTLQAVIGVTLLQRFGFRLSMDRLRDVLGFVSLAVLVTPVINATIGTAFYSIVAGLSWMQVVQNWWTIWLGDGMGILILTPSLLALQHWAQQNHFKFAGLNSRFLKSKRYSGLNSEQYAGLLTEVDRPSDTEKWTWLSLLIAMSWIVFHAQPNPTIALYPIEYLPFPFIIWAALRFGHVRTILASFVLSVIAISGTILGRGPFIAKASDPNQVVLLLQAFIGVITITALILAAVMATRQAAEIQLRLNAERNRLLSEMAMRIRQSLDLEEILQTTVEEVRQFLHADRVFFSCFDRDGHGSVVAESIVPGWASTIGWTTDAQVYQELQSMFAQEPIRVVADTAQSAVSSFLKQYHDRFHVKAGIAVPIVLNSAGCAAMGCRSEQATQSEADWSSNTPDTPNLFGVLVVNQCSTSRQWQPLEVELLEELGTQVTIAIQQGQLYKRVQNLNANLEHQVAERTLQLQANMAELQELNQLRDVLIHAIAHDLRTTVMGSLMVLKNLQNQPGDNIAMSRTLLERMTQSGEIQLCKLNSLLDAYKNKTEGIVINPDELALPSFVQHITSDMKPMFELNQASLINKLPDNLPPVAADRDQLERVFRHLMVNAVKHNPPGVTVTLKAEIAEDKIRCVVEDDGKGISPSQCDRLFDLKIGTAQERQLTGLSLGLYLCQQIITAHGGEIGVDSTLGMGSQFWFTLPLW
jgi:signal transduction histidine kinase/integral membrane sensor domain MASE1